MSASRSSDVEAPRDAHLLGEWARLLFGTLREAGVADVWVSPGSRSTPFTYAAARTEGLTLRAVVDERSAAFLALGHARVSGRPSALLCTSGTAAANYFPAVVEASQAYLPLVVLTADRPLEVQHAHAAQTIDQLKLFGDYARCFYDLGLPDAAPGALTGLRRAVTQAVAQARGPLPGPVHLNLRARKPLEPAPAGNDAERALTERVSELLATPLARYAPTLHLANEAVHAAARALSGAASGAIVVGPLSMASHRLAKPVAQLARLTGFPVFAETSSQVRFELEPRELGAPLFDWVLSTPRGQALRPEVLLCLGGTPTSSAFERWAAQVPQRIVLTEHGYADALGTASVVASGDLHQGLEALLAELERLPRPPRDPAFSRSFRDVHLVCERRVAEALGAPASELSEGAVVKAVLESVPSGAVLALGNSLPIRHADAYVTRAKSLRVVSQRGANGIDGLVAGAIGSAIASGSPTLLLLGDVSLLHDLSSLASAELVTTPLVIAIVDNAGGRIFDQLPVRKLYEEAPDLSRLWLTPAARDWSHAASLFGLAYAAPTTLDAVRGATEAALLQPGVTLLHLRVGPHSAAELRARVLSAVAADLSGTAG